MIEQILLPLMSHPEPTPDWAISIADELAVQLDAELCAITSVINVPDASNALARQLVGADTAIAAENNVSRINARGLAERFASITGSAQPVRQYEVETRHFFIDPEPIARHARLFDLTILPMYGHPDTQFVAEALLFSSGRPLLLLPSGEEAKLWQNVLIAWDGSRAAARAVADAMPILQCAKKVQAVTVTGDKVVPGDLSLEALREHLKHHDIQCELAEIVRDGDAGASLLAHGRSCGSSLLVMGGYGHSRLREFVLGGATRTILYDASLPVLLSH